MEPLEDQLEREQITVEIPDGAEQVTPPGVTDIAEDSEPADEPAEDPQQWRREAEELRRANAGLRSDLIRNRQDASRLRAREESLAALEAKINARLDPPAPPPDGQADPIGHLKYDTREAIRPIAEELGQIRQYVEEAKEQRKAEQVQGAIAARLSSELGGDAERQAQYHAQANHAFEVFRHLYGDAAEAMAYQAMAKAVSEGGMITDFVSTFAQKTGWQPQAAQTQVSQPAPVQRPQPAQRAQPKALGAVSGGSAGTGRRVTWDQFEQFADQNPEAAYQLTMDPLKWNQFEQNKSIIL